MPALFLLSSVSYAIVAIVLLGFGLVYLARNRFLPYLFASFGPIKKLNAQLSPAPDSRFLDKLQI